MDCEPLRMTMSRAIWVSISASFRMAMAEISSGSALAMRLAISSRLKPRC